LKTLNRIKVAFIHLYGEMGGNEIVTLHLVRELDKKRFEPVVILNSDGPFAGELRKVGVRVDILQFRTLILKQLVYPFNLFRAAADARKLEAYFEHDPPHIVQCSDVLALLLVLRSIRRWNIPIIYGLVFVYEWLRLMMFSLLAMSHVKAIVVNAGSVERDLRRRAILTGQRVVRVYPGHDKPTAATLDAHNSFRLHAELGVPRETKLIGIIGRIDPMKGQLLFLRAARQIARRRSDAVFLVIGSPMNAGVIPGVSAYYDRLLHYQQESGLDRSVRFLGRRDDMDQILQSLDVFVSASVNEGFGMALVEAYLAGLPVVTGPHAGALEVLNSGEGVFIADPGDTDSLASGIENALVYSSDPDLKSRLRKRRTVRSGDWKQYAGSFELLYTELAAA